jgi:intracellular sulfur oxidation DsrE/DsrF family protein
MLKKALLLCGALVLAVSGTVAMADRDAMAHSDTACPVGLVSGQTLDQEFGQGASTLTRCIKRRHRVRLLVEINRYCRDDDAAVDADGKCAGPGADALGNMVNIIKDYKITHGMVPGRDYDIVAVVHGMGGRLLLNDSAPLKNGYMDDVKSLMDEGVTFYFCQNTVRGFMRSGRINSGDAVNEVIPGVRFVTAGFTALADFQSLGWTQVSP